MRLILTLPNFDNSYEVDKLIEAMELEEFDFLHVRKKASEEFVSEYIEKFPKKIHSKIIVHNMPNLVVKYKLKGCHFSQLSSLYKRMNFYTSLTTHSFSEIDTFGFLVDVCYLSPIFDSISKKNYYSNFNTDELGMFLSKKPKSTKIFALGGVDLENYSKLIKLGFDGAVFYGSFWNL